VLGFYVVKFNDAKIQKFIEKKLQHGMLKRMFFFVFLWFTNF